MITARGAGYAALTGTLLAGLAAGASAGDIASLRPIGFSADGGVFAFEEYGIQDGSGFPYSNIYAIDTVKDAYLPGTPVRIRIDDEAAGLGAARAQAAQKAAPILAAHAPDDHPGQLVAFNPVSEMESDPHQLRYLAYPADPAFGKPYGLRLEEKPQPPPAACKDLLPEIKAFRLLLTEKDGAPVSETVHEDQSVPKSRGCTSGYRLGGVVTHQPPGGSHMVHMAMVMVLSFGFEGRDGRWIAVPVHP